VLIGPGCTAFRVIFLPPVREPTGANMKLRPPSTLRNLQSRGKRVFRMELRRGDCGKVSRDWSDCLHGNERVQMVTSVADICRSTAGASMDGAAIWRRTGT